MRPLSEMPRVKRDQVPTIEDYNKIVRYYARNRPVRINDDRVGKWRHPWDVSGRWDPGRESWTIRIRPGFVNGTVPDIRIDADEAPQLTIDRVGTGPSRVNARLTEKPIITVDAGRMRKIGPDAEPTRIPETGIGTIEFEAVPPFFSDLGVGQPPRQSLTPSGTIEGDLSGVNQPKNRERLLRAFEVILNQERISTRTDWTFGTGGEGGFAQYDVTYDNLDYRREPYITLAPSYAPRGDSLTGDDFLRGDWQDNQLDQLHLATVYLVSERGADPGSTPDSDWQLFTQNHVFWNVNYATNILPVDGPADPLSLRFTTALAGGSGTPLIDDILGDLNDQFSEIEEFLQNNLIQGRFWTT